MDPSISWDYCRDVLLRDGQEGAYFRLSPIILLETIPELLRRRSHRYSDFESKMLTETLWLVRAETHIPATLARSARNVSSSFLVGQTSPGYGVIIAAADRDTYQHGARLLERSVYPLAVRPSLPTTLALTILDRETQSDQSIFQVIQLRGRTPESKTKWLFHGEWSLDAALNQSSSQKGRLEGARIRVVSNDGTEMLRARIDGWCRLLVERWSVRRSPVEMVQLFAERFATLIRGAAVEREVQFASSHVYLLRVPSGWNLHDVAELSNRLQAQPGVLVYTFQLQFTGSVQVLDFISGVTCTLQLTPEEGLALSSVSPVPNAFLDRLVGLIEVTSQVRSAYG